MHSDRVCSIITDLNMRESSISVVSAVIKLQDRIVFKIISRINMKASIIHVTSVIIEQQQTLIFGDIFTLYTKVSDMDVNIVIILLHKIAIYRNTSHQCTVIQSRNEVTSPHKVMSSA